MDRKKRTGIRRAAVILLSAMLLLTLLPGCRKSAGKTTTGLIGVVKDEEFGNVYIDLTIEEFNALGFSFGDSIDVEFDNGTALRDIPYYSGYYVPVGELLACGYPGYPHVIIARNYGASTWEEFKMTESSKVTVTLNEKAKYLEHQELYALSYSDERNEYESDEQFANFREVRGGKLRDKTIYRSASPCDNQHKRASYANRFAEESGIRYVLNLSDNETKYQSYVEAEGFGSFYYDSLMKEGNVQLLAMNANYRSDEFAAKLCGGLLQMAEHEGPCLVHCVEGKDRTGFACALILALADASAGEIMDDYMITYANYYKITKDNNPKKYEVILENVYDFLWCMCDAEKGTPLEKLDLKSGAENYLRKGGLGDAEIRKVEAYLQ